MFAQSAFGEVGLERLARAFLNTIREEVEPEHLSLRLRLIRPSEISPYQVAAL
jgi:hypothetical protein